MLAALLASMNHVPDLLCMLQRQRAAGARWYQLKLRSSERLTPPRQYIWLRPAAAASNAQGLSNMPHCRWRMQLLRPSQSLVLPIAAGNAPTGLLNVPQHSGAAAPPLSTYGATAQLLVATAMYCAHASVSPLAAYHGV
jgi:hypothetical protein